MIKVKICGITHQEDAQVANELGAFALGFIFTPQSKRYNSPENYSMIRNLNLSAIKVGVFVNQSVEEVNRIALETLLDKVQLHGDESESYISHISLPIWKSVTPEQVLSGKFVTHPNIEFYIVDTVINGQSGGTGIPFSWEIIQSFQLPKPFFIAGGITLENIHELVTHSTVKFIDISSGVEKSPGIKDHMKMSLIFEAVKM